MSNRIRAAAFVFALAAGASGQSIQVHPALKRGSDPFSIEKGSSFSAASRSAPKQSTPFVTTGSVVSDLQEALSVIRQNHVGTPAPAELTRSSISSMLKSLDPHSNYYDRTEYEELRDEQRSEYFGTGSTIAEYERDGRTSTYLLSTFPGSAAEKAGLRFGDRVVAVNGRAAANLEYSTIRDMLRGPRGTAVSLTVERAGKNITVSLRRDRVPQKTVTDFYLIGEGVGIIRMPEGFSFTSYEEFDAAYRQLTAQGMTSLVFDLRGNPGGILDQSVKIAEKFLPEGSVIVSQRGRSAVDNRIWRSNNRSPETLPVVVLVDGDSASAAEVIAGALQDNDRAVIVGEKTFGKGLVQSVLDLPSGGGLTLTTARYYTPSGRSLQRDYEHSGAYDYYNHAENTVVASKPSLTRTKRKVYGGDGVTPDVGIAPERITRERLALIDPIFHFAREASFANRPEPTVELLSKFREFAACGWGIPDASLDRNADFIKLRLAHDLDLAGRGPVAASRVLLKNDPQLTKAIKSVPQAVSFASSYYVSRNPNKR